jgi:hypothetical protein
MNKGVTLQALDVNLLSTFNIITNFVLIMIIL